MIIRRPKISLTSAAWSAVEATRPSTEGDWLLTQPEEEALALRWSARKEKGWVHVSIQIKLEYFIPPSLLEEAAVAIPCDCAYSDYAPVAGLPHEAEAFKERLRLAL